MPGLLYPGSYIPGMPFGGCGSPGFLGMIPRSSNFTCPPLPWHGNLHGRAPFFNFSPTFPRVKAKFQAVRGKMTDRIRRFCSTPMMTSPLPAYGSPKPLRRPLQTRQRPKLVSNKGTGLSPRQLLPKSPSLHPSSMGVPTLPCPRTKTPIDLGT